MNPTKSFQVEILEFIKKQKTTTAREIKKNFNISQVTIFKHLKRLVENRLVIKTGTPPKVYYIYQDIETKTDLLEGKIIKTGGLLGPGIDPIVVNKQQNFLINGQFVNITAAGVIQYGIDGFEAWCKQQNLDCDKTALEYGQTWKKYLQFYTQVKFYKHKKLDIRYIDSTFKLQENAKPCVDKMYYLD